MLTGATGACVGATIHQILRDPSVLRKQLFYSMFRFILDGVNISRLSSAWRSHRERFVREEDGPVALEQFEMWSDALRHTLVSTVSALLEKLIYAHAGDDRYCRYVDWIASVGVVPLFANETVTRLKEVSAAQRELTAALRSCQLLDGLDDATLKTLRRCVAAMMTSEVPNAANLRMHRLKSNGEIECFAGKKRLRRYVHSEPLVLEEDHLALTTPLSRIRYERARHHELRTHRKVCQLLNTHPVKVVTSSRYEMNTRRIVELMEKRDRNVDAKASIVKFLLNVSDSKSKIGLEDSVESFLQDLTPSVDQSRLMPPRPPSGAGGGAAHGPLGPGTQDIRELFRRQVIRCLEEQIQDHVEEIESLKLLNKAWEGKTRELRDALERYETDGRRTRGPPSADLQTADTLRALRRVQDLPTNPTAVEDNRVVANSFFSQFVPDDRDSDDRLSKLWENEYFRCFKLRRNVTNQGAEDSISYSNYTVEKVLSPFLTSVLQFPLLDPIPEDHLFLSLSELAHVVYETSRLQRYTDFLRFRETARIYPAAAAAATTSEAPTPRPGGAAVPRPVATTDGRRPPAPGPARIRDGRPRRARRPPGGPTTPYGRPGGALGPMAPTTGDGTTRDRTPRAWAHTAGLFPGAAPPPWPSPVGHPYIRSPWEKLDTLRRRRNVQHING